MKAFWKENSYDIVKMFIYQIGITILGLIVSMAMAMLSSRMELEVGSRWPLLVGSIFASSFYLFLLFYMTLELGGKDGVRIEAGRRKFNKLKGLYMSLMANSLNILLAVLAIVGKAFVTNIGFFSNDTSVEGIPAFAAGLNSVSELIANLLNSMYLGIRIEYFSGNPLFYLMMVVPALVVCTVAYLCGVKRAMSGEKMSGGKKNAYKLGDDDDNNIYYQQ